MIKADTLTEMVLTNLAIPVRFGDHKFIFDGAGVMYWPKYDILVFSDLHFEKGSFLTQFAHPVPRYDTRETIARMGKLIERYNPRCVLCLGDSFHDGNAIRRMESEQIEAVNQLIKSTQEWIWILGNHDPEIPNSMSGQRMNKFINDNLVFLHEPEAFDSDSYSAQIVGHFHPKTSTKIARHKVSGTCFVVGQSLLILPAFGKYTGGLCVQHEAIYSLFDSQGMKCFLNYHNKIFLV